MKLSEIMRRTLSGGKRLVRSISIPALAPAILAITGCLTAGSGNLHGAGAPDDHTVLILGATVSGGASSIEAQEAAAAGFTVEVVDDATWGAKTAAEFHTYRALILGDPNCGYPATPVAAAEANKAVWGSVIDGNVIIIGTDEVLHDSSGGRQVSRNGVRFAADIPGKTGMFVSLSCYYHGVAPGTPVPVLSPFGAFTATGVAGCFDDAHIVATHPALTGITDASLSNWGCSVHNAFDSFPIGFNALAIAENQAGPGNRSFPDGTNGIPYILARGEGLVVISDITLTPGSATNPVGTSHTVNAKVITNIPVAGTPVVGTTVTFTVLSGPNAGTTGPGVTNASGDATFTYSDLGGAGTDQIQASFVDASSTVRTSNIATKNWVSSLAAVPDSLHICNGTSVTADPRVNDIGGGLTITGHTNGSLGTVSHTATSVTYTQTTPYFGTDTFTYTITDTEGSTATATVTVTTVTSLVALKGDQVSGQPAGVVYKKFGIPSIVEGGTVAFRADLVTDDGTKKVIVAGLPPTVLVTKGDVAPGTGGNKFKSFKDPVANNFGEVAFLAAITAGTPETSKGLWSNYGGALQLVARNGTPAPLIPGAILRGVKSAVITDGGVIFTGVLQIAGAVNGNNDIALWYWEPIGGYQLLLREGQSMSPGGTAEIVKNFKALVAVSKSPGHGRTFGSEVTTLVKFVSGNTAIVQVAPGVTEIEVYSGGTLTTGIPSAQWKNLGIPAANHLGHYAFLGLLETGPGGVTSAVNAAIFASSGGAALDLIAQKGGDAPGVASGKFGSFKAPLINSDDNVAFLAKLKGPGLNSTNNSGIWFGNAAGIELVAQIGSPAKDVPGGLWATFTSLALPDNLGPAFTAKLKLGGDITKTNNFGLWGMDGDGELCLLVRTGDNLPVVTGAPRTVKKLTILRPVGGTAGQGRAYSVDSSLIYRVDFTDKTQAILKVQFPSEPELE